jgi:hypothetical protein
VFLDEMLVQRGRHHVVIRGRPHQHRSILPLDRFDGQLLAGHDGDLRRAACVAMKGRTVQAVLRMAHPAMKRGRHVLDFNYGVLGFRAVGRQLK